MSAGCWAGKWAIQLAPGDRVRFDSHGGSGTVVRASPGPTVSVIDARTVVTIQLMPLHPDDTLPPQERQLPWDGTVQVREDVP